jgi:beta-mannosidase
MVGSSDNMFVRYKFDVKPFLKSGLNAITVAFESAVTYAKRKHDEQFANYSVPPGIEMS